MKALKRQLAKVRSGSRRLQRRWTLEHGLHTARAEGLKAGQYLAQIGRMLGM